MKLRALGVFLTLALAIPAHAQVGPNPHTGNQPDMPHPDPMQRDDPMHPDGLNHADIRPGKDTPDENGPVNNGQDHVAGVNLVVHHRHCQTVLRHHHRVRVCH